MSVSVDEDPDGTYRVIVDGKPIKTGLSHTDAWKIADRMADECLSPIESRFYYGFRQSANRG